MSDKDNRQTRKKSLSEEGDLFETIFKEATLEIRREKAVKNGSPETFSIQPPGRWQQQSTLPGTGTQIFKPRAEVLRKSEKAKASLSGSAPRVQSIPLIPAGKTGSQPSTRPKPTAAVVFSLLIIFAGIILYYQLDTLDLGFLLDYFKTGGKGEVAQVSVPEKQSTRLSEKVTAPSSQPKKKNQSPATVQDEPESPLPAQAGSDSSIRTKEDQAPEKETPATIKKKGARKSRIEGEEPSAIASDRPNAPEAAANQESQPAHAKAEFSSKPDASKIAPSQLSTPKKYPYSVYLGSFKTADAVKKAMSEFYERGLSPYRARVDLGEKGVWFRFFAGHFQSKEEAEKFIRERSIQGAEPAKTKYANLIGVYDSDQEGEGQRGILAAAGFYPYIIRSSDGKRLLYSGAFDRKEYAEKERILLTSKGIKAETVER